MPADGPDGERPAKNYLGEALLTALLYYLGLGVSGLIANLYFMRRAQREAGAGIPTRNAGCLTAVLVFHAALLVLVLAGLVAVRLMGGFAAVFGGG